MATAVLDASVILAALNGEVGADVAAGLIPISLLLSVNLAEAATKLADDGLPRADVYAILESLECEIVPFDRALAVEAGLLRPLTRKQGLSLGGRACVALGLARGLPVYTAERSWAGLSLPELEVRLIR